jgi:hypothetical protein
MMTTRKKPTRDQREVAALIAALLAHKATPPALAYKIGCFVSNHVDAIVDTPEVIALLLANLGADEKGGTR